MVFELEERASAAKLPKMDCSVCGPVVELRTELDSVDVD